MQKEAQKRGLLNKLRESTNIGGIMAENWFDPEFKEIMTKLREETDDPIRAIISGQQIGDFSPPDNISLKEILKSARSNFNRREYMKCVGDLGKFHKRLNDIITILNKFSVNLDKVHHRFLFGDLTPDSPEYNQEYAEYLQDLKQRFSEEKLEEKKAELEYNLVKEAGILDFFRNIGTEKGRALAAWEKRYPGRVKELKKETLKLIDHSEKLLNTIIGILKKMATARATRKVDDYIKYGSDIVKSYGLYNTEFKKYYDSQIKNFLDSPQFSAPVKPVEDTKELEKQDIGNPKVEPKLTKELGQPIKPYESPAENILNFPGEKGSLVGVEQSQKPFVSPTGGFATVPAYTPGISTAPITPKPVPTQVPIQTQVTAPASENQTILKGKVRTVPQEVKADQFPEIKDPEIRATMGLKPLPGTAVSKSEPVKTPEVLMRRPLKPPPSKPAHFRFIESAFSAR